MAKRMNGEGSIRLRKDGRWECRLTDGRQDNGKPIIVSFYGKTQAEVKKKLAAYKQAQYSGIDTHAHYTFDQWSDIWYENHTEISTSTKEGYKYTLRILKNKFGRWKLEDVKALDIENFLKQLRADGRSASALAQCRGMLFQIFQKAVANDILMKNPVQFAQKLRSTEAPRVKDAFSAEEVRLLMTKLPQDLMGLTIRLMLGTGMRSQEVMALEPYLIEEDGSVIHIRQAVVRLKGGIIIGPPKSKDSYRDIPVPPGLQEIARRFRDTPNKFIWEVGIPGQPCNPSYFQKKYKESLATVEGVRILTPHCCRHTYVSQLQSLGVDMETIKSIVGHADTNMTEHYLHVQDPIRKDAAAKFSEIFLGGEINDNAAP